MYYPQQWDVPTYCTCYLVLQNSIQILFTPSLFQHVFSECPLYSIAQHYCASHSRLQVKPPTFSFPEFWRRLQNYWRRQWQPTPVLLPGKSRGQRSLVGCSPWGRGISGSRGEAGRWSLVCTSQSTAVSCLDISFSLRQPCLLQTAGRRCPCASPPMGAVGGSHFPERVNKNSLRFLKNKYTLPLQQAELVCLSHAYFFRKTGHARFANKSQSHRWASCAHTKTIVHKC